MKNMDVVFEFVFGCKIEEKIINNLEEFITVKFGIINKGGIFFFTDLFNEIC